MVDVQYGKAAQEGDYVIVVHNRYNSTAVTGVGKLDRTPVTFGPGVC